MKKTLITLTLILGLTAITFADSGLFNRGYNAKNGASGYIYFNAKDATNENVATPLLPNHGLDADQPAPLGSGLVLLAGLGAAYLVGKKRREE